MLLDLVSIFIVLYFCQCFDNNFFECLCDSYKGDQDGGQCFTTGVPYPYSVSGYLAFKKQIKLVGAPRT